MTVAALLILLFAMGFALWGALALMHRAPFAAPWPGALAVGFLGLSLLAIALAWRLRNVFPLGWPALMVLGALFGAVLIWWASIKPDGRRDWAEPLARQPRVSVEGDRYTVQDVRNFRWRKAAGAGEGSGEEVAEARWETRSYDLSKAAGVDLFFSYWSGPLIAHLLVSVPFDDAPPLSFSIEIRREKGEAYSALAGFFKSYELSIVAADEEDVVRLRTDVWREDVRLYRLNVGRAKARELLMAYADEINALAARPRWYDTLGANCSTVAFRLARRLWPDLAFDWRILAPGKGPDYAYAIGALGAELPLDEIKRRSAISEKARGVPAGADFSAAIREGAPGPR
jgi:hypothetical protein